MPANPRSGKILKFPVSNCLGVIQYRLVLRRIKAKGKQHDSRCKLVRGVIGVDGIGSPK